MDGIHLVTHTCALTGAQVPIWFRLDDAGELMRQLSEASCLSKSVPLADPEIVTTLPEEKPKKGKKEAPA